MPFSHGLHGEVSDQHASNQKGIFKIINILKLMWSLSPFFQFLVGCIAVIPHIPLIKGKVNALFAMLFRTDSVADADYAGNKSSIPLEFARKSGVSSAALP